MIRPPSIYCDEDVHGAVCRGLLRLGIDASSVATQGNLGLENEEQLAYAASSGRALFTHNVEDFPRIHRDMMIAETHHAGIIVCRQDLGIGEIIRRIARLCAALTAEQMHNR